MTASCGIEPKRIVAYEPLINEALQLASHKPKKIITISREEVKLVWSHRRIFPAKIDQ